MVTRVFRSTLLFWMLFCSGTCINYSIKFQKQPLSVRTGCDDDPLRCFLSTITIDIPDSCITLGMGVQICLSRFVCRGLLSDKFSSSYVRPRGMSVDAVGLQTVCNGQYKFEMTHGQAKANAKLSDMRAAFYLPQNSSDLLPTAFEFNNCTVGTVHIDLSFTGGGYIDGFANEISRILEDIVDKEIRRILCSEVSKFVTKNFTNIIQRKVDPPVRQIIRSLPSDYVVADDAAANYVNIRRAIEELQELSWKGRHSSFGRCLQRALFHITGSGSGSSSSTGTGISGGSTDTETETPAVDFDETLTNLAGSVIALLTNNSGNVTFRLPPHQSVVTVPFSGGNLTVSVGAISLHGLNHLKSIDLSVPPTSSNITVRMAANVGALGATIDVSLGLEEYSHFARGTVKRSLKVLLSLQELKVSMDLVLGISKSHIESLFLDQVRDLPATLCWLTAATEIFNISSLQIQVPDSGVTVQTIDMGPPSASLTSLHPKGDLRDIGESGERDRSSDGLHPHSHADTDTTNLTADLIEAIGNGLLVISKGYGNLMPSLIDGLAQGPLRAELNRVVASYLKSFNGTALCPHHEHHHNRTHSDPSDPNDELLVWSDSSLQRLLRPFAHSADSNINLIHLIAGCLSNHSGAMSVTIADKWKLAASGLQSVFNATVLKPLPPTMRRPYDLYSAMGIGKCNNGLSCESEATAVETEKKLPGQSCCEPFTISLTSSSSSGFEMKLLLYNTFLQAGMTAEVSITALADLQLKNLISLDEEGDRVQTASCLATSLRTLRIHTLGLTAGRATLAVHGVEPAEVDITPIVERFFAHAGDEVALEQVNGGISKWRTSVEKQCQGLPTHHEQPIAPDGLAGLDLDESILIGTGIAVAAVGFLMSVYWYWYWNWEDDQNSDNNARVGKEEGHLYNGGSDADWVPSEESVPGSGSGSTTCTTSAAVSPRLDVPAAGDHRPPDKSRLHALALVSHPTIHPLVRTLVPIVLVANLCLFILSNGSTEAVSVLMHINAGNVQRSSDAGSPSSEEHHAAFLSSTFPLFFFGLTSTVRDMWKADVKPLAILVALFSGVWPYAKLLCLLFCWMSPLSALLSLKLRGSLLMAVDAFGKWSLVDFFVMVLMMCAFYLDLDLRVPLRMKADDKDYRDIRAGVSVVVQPNCGFYLFLVATIISIVMGHIVLAFHRYAVSITEPLNGSVNMPPPSASASSGRSGTSTSTSTSTPLVTVTVTGLLPALIDRSYLVPTKYFETPSGHRLPISMQAPTPLQLSSSPSDSSRSGKVAVRISKSGRRIILGSLVATMLTLILGSVLDTVMFEMSGLTGFLLGDQAKVKYSMISIGTKMVAAQADPAGVTFLQICFYIFGLAAPIAFTALAIALWLAPMKKERLGWLHYSAEILYAWAALDVFCVSIAAALLEIGQFASFAVGRKCNDLNALLAEAFDGPLQLHGNDKCFDVSAHLLPNSWLLFLSALLLLLLGPPTVYLSGEKHTTHYHHSIRSTATITTTSSSDHATNTSAERVKPDLSDRTRGPPAAKAWSHKLLTSSASLPPQSFDAEAKRPLLFESHLSDNDVDNDMISGARRVCSDTIVHNIPCPETNTAPTVYKRVRMGFTRMAVECLIAVGLIEICTVASEEC